MSVKAISPSVCMRVRACTREGGMCVIVCRYTCVWRRPEVDVSYSSWLLFSLLTLNPSLPLQPDSLAQDLHLRLPSTGIGSGPCTSSLHSQGPEGSEVSHPTFRHTAFITTSSPRSISGIFRGCGEQSQKANRSLDYPRNTEQLIL